MSLLTFENLSHAYGGYDVFSRLSGRIEPDSKIGLVGPNGIGKTTLLQLLAGLDTPFGGDVHLLAGTRIGYLRQEAVLAFADTSNSLYDEMRSVFERVFHMEQHMRSIEQKMADSSATDQDYETYGLLQEKVELGGLYDYERRIERTLAGLGFEESDWQKPLEILSGGQKTRALLAKLLLDVPDLLIMDEPTNHLDIEALRWLEGTLYAWKGALLIVSHDRYFLDKVVNRIWEMTPERIETYRGNYSAYVQQRQQRRDRTQFEWQQMIDRFEKEFEYIQRMGLGDKNAKGRFRRLTREVEAVQSHGIDAMLFVRQHGWMRYTQEYTRSNPPQSVADLKTALRSLQNPVQNQRDMRLKLNADDRSGENVLRARRLAVGYERGEPLFTADDIDLTRGDVAALIGPNGVGKTTFLKTLMKELQPLKGHITYGASLEIGYFAQAHDSLDHTNTVLEELMRHRYGMTISEARHYLAPYLFTGEDVFKEVSALSGGERGRLALAVLSLNGANLLLLDEPTNHLDIPAQEVLQDVLERFDGTVILVSHDRYLIDRLGTQIWDLREGHLRVFKGTYQEYLKTLEDTRAADEEAAKPAPQPDDESAVDAKALSKLETQITTLEDDITELETLLAHASAAGNSETLKTLSQQYKSRQRKLEDLMKEWTLLAEQA